ncbi:MAG: Fe-S-cluster-containing dehydrogenase component/anaerobic selenocysteine-containing dehydrogenase [Myxococcota bacterium]|jgi:Fe-S-cluster-containing dehydrogenase component/anaerobic selenocysteine-containing dehydrogenase
MSRLNRRDFLKTVGLTGTVSAAAACRWDDNRYITPIENLLPYVLKQEDQVPGTPTFYATTVTTGPHAHPVNGRNREGRVVNVGVNPEAPWQNGVPAAALLGLQRHYSPDRIHEPTTGAGDAATPLTWDDAMGRVTSAVQAAGDKKVAYLGPYRSGAIVTLINELTDGNAVFWEPLGYEAEADAAEALFGQRILPGYDLAKAHYVLSFGANFLSGWGGTKLASQYADARNPNLGNFVARFAYVGPHLDQTAANSDDWYSCSASAQAGVALALASLVADKKGTRAALGSALPVVDVAAMALAAGLTTEKLESIATQMASMPSVALPGGASGATTGAVDLAAATYLLNLASGAAGVTFGMGRHYEGPIHGYSDLKALQEELDAGNVAVLFVDDINPAYSLPASAGMAASLQNAGMLVSVNSHPDETQALAGLTLPTHDLFEDWGDEIPEAGLVLARQPTMSPLHNTRSLGDILLTIGKGTVPAVPAADETEDGTAIDAAVALDGEEAVETALPALGYTPENWRDYLSQTWQRSGMVTGSDFEQGHYQALAKGFLEAPGRSLTPPALAGSHSFGAAGAYAGSGDVILHAYPHPFRQDGRFANEPWAQEVPDPMSGRTWGSWGEMHPETAASMDIADGDLITVSQGDVSIQVAAELTPGIAAGTIAIAFGQGHTAQGDYAKFGANVVDLMAATATSGSGLAWQATHVSISNTGEKANVPSTLGGDQQGGRDLAPAVPAAELAAVGDSESAHPGELTGIHHLPRDPRLVETGNLDFYPVPEHPNYRWAMTVDTNACNGCGICSVACYAENNLPVVGRQLIAQGREMNWIRINRYWETNPDGSPDARFLPMMCQHCGHAPCESVCPVLATYHNIEGLNAMVYNRCVGTRYCANNCPYQARRFNFHSYVWPEPFHLQLNPDVSTRQMGVMEKCTFCVQRTREIKGVYRDQGFTTKVPSAAVEQLPACAEACPSQAITFGNLNEESSKVAMSRKSGRSYIALDELNTASAVNYLGRANFHVELDHHGAGHGEEYGDDHADSAHGEDHGDAAHGSDHVDPSHDDAGDHAGDHQDDAGDNAGGH